MKNKILICISLFLAIWVQIFAPNAPNDGFILEAEMTTGAAGVPTYQNEEVNHMEVLNHPEMWNHFNDIFNRPDPDFFRTNPR